MRERREQRRAQLLIFRERRRLDRFANQQGPIDGDGGLFENGGQRTLVLSGKRLLRDFGFDAAHADYAARRSQRPKLKPHIGQSAGAPPGRLGFFQRAAPASPAFNWSIGGHAAQMRNSPSSGMSSATHFMSSVFCA